MTIGKYENETHSNIWEITHSVLGELNIQSDPNILKNKYSSVTRKYFILLQYR